MKSIEPLTRRIEMAKNNCAALEKIDSTKAYSVEEVVALAKEN